MRTDLSCLDRETAYIMYSIGLLLLESAYSDRADMIRSNEAVSVMLTCQRNCVEIS
jgi:hypothetical protein